MAALRAAGVAIAEGPHLIGATLRDLLRRSKGRARWSEAPVAADTGGSIVVISSISGTQAMPFGAPYAAAKAGLLAFVRTAGPPIRRAGACRKESSRSRKI